jgi:hypothetical protein
MSEFGAVDIDAVSRTLECLLVRSGRPVILGGGESGEMVEVAPDSAAAADGLLPVFLVAAEAVWRECLGEGFGLEIARDADALLGYRVVGIAAGMFSGVMLSMMEAMAQAVRSGQIMVNELDFVWRSALDRMEALDLVPAGGDGKAPS